MTTAKEIEMKMAAASDALYRSMFTLRHNIVSYGMHILIGRSVGAVRARKLRRRGEDVRYTGRTSTGKSRYLWTRSIPPWSLYKT